MKHVLTEQHYLLARGILWTMTGLGVLLMGYGIYTAWGPLALTVFVGYVLFKYGAGLAGGLERAKDAGEFEVETVDQPRP